MLKVVVIDDHDIVRKGIIAYLKTEPDLKVAGEASSGEEGIAVVLAERPDVVLMDLIMENGSGITATRKIMENLPDCRIIILTSYYDDEQIFPALEAGAFSYMLKTSKAEEISAAIKKAYKGEPVIESKVAGKMMTSFRPEPKKPHEQLTDRELEVLLCLGNGMTNQEIGEELYIGIKTVKTHVSNILGKLDVHDRTQAAVYVHRNKLI